MLLKFIVSIILLLTLQHKVESLSNRSTFIIMKSDKKSSGFGNKVKTISNEQSSSTIQAKSNSKLSNNKKGISLLSSNDLERNIQNKIDSIKNLRLAIELQQNIDDFNKLTEMMSPLEQTLMPADKLLTLQSKKRQLEALQDEGFSKQNILSRLLEITYDESAEMRFLRHQTQEASKDMENFMISLARIIIDAASNVNTNRNILDIGCGDGILIKYLTLAAAEDKSNFDCSAITGIDLSNEMIKISKENYPNSQFFKANFLDYEASTTYRSIVFNEVLHNFLSIEDVLSKASKLLCDKGVVVVSHPRGYDNLVTQYSKNRMLVPSLLPKTESEWEKILKDKSLKLKIKKFYSTTPYLIVFENI